MKRTDTESLVATELARGCYNASPIEGGAKTVHVQDLEIIGQEAGIGETEMRAIGRALGGTRGRTSQARARKIAAARRKERRPRRVIVSLEAISGHPLLSSEQQGICRMLREDALQHRESFTLLDFAEISLRATGNDYAAVTDSKNLIDRATADLDHRKAAILFTYEALRACDVSIVSEYPELDQALDLLYWLSENLP